MRKNRKAMEEVQSAVQNIAGLSAGLTWNGNEHCSCIWKADADSPYLPYRDIGAAVVLFVDQVKQKFLEELRRWSKLWCFKCGAVNIGSNRVSIASKRPLIKTHHTSTVSLTHLKCYHLYMTHMIHDCNGETEMREAVIDVTASHIAEKVREWLLRSEQ